ncbi:MAG TPA: hypothetical protein VL652_36420 [Kutzneria sp.]|jgi:hypothetical protein|nr:hypothetical protein [Kutzneria sp.]
MRLHRRLLTSLCMVTAAMAVTASIASAAAPPPPRFGISFTGTTGRGDDPAQCGGPKTQWNATPNWSTPIRLDTDGRRGGCLLGFGLQDPSHVFAGLDISYQWYPTGGGNDNQCGSPGQYTVPTNVGYGPNIIVDTDDSAGGCYLVFSVSGRDDVALDIKFYADTDNGQCGNALPQNEYWTASSSESVTLLDDTDGRPGGCELQFRLSQITPGQS